MSDVTVICNEDKNRYEAHINGELAGFTEYIPGEGFAVMPHTEVFEQFEGKGVGSKLARGALDHLKSQNLSVQATCPFIHSWIRRHEDYHPMLYKGKRHTVQDDVEQD